MITTPNVEGFFPRFTYALFGRTFGVWDHPGPPGHVYQFGARTLAAALDRAGFDLLESRTTPVPLDYTVGALEDCVVDILKGRQTPESQSGSSLATKVSSPQQSGAAPVRLAKRAMRQLVRAFCWVVAAGVAMPAQWMGSGDSLIVVARSRAEP